MKIKHCGEFMNREEEFVRKCAVGFIESVNKEEDYKMVFLVRGDLEMSPGKLFVQSNQATAMCLKNASDGAKQNWYQGCIRCIVLEVEDDKDLVKMNYKLDAIKIPHYLTIDIGATEFGKPTVTCLGIGPAESDLIDGFTGDYPLYKPNEEFLQKEYGLDKNCQDIMKTINKRTSNIPSYYPRGGENG